MELTGRLGNLADRVLDWTVLPGFSRIGYALRESLVPRGPLQLEGRSAMVTGASAGIGEAACGQLARAGARVWMVVRDRERGERARRRITAPGPAPELLLCDLSSLASVREAGAELLARVGRLDVLVNNAGVLPDRRIHTEEGFELTFATTVLGPFLLTALLLPALLVVALRSTSCAGSPPGSRRVRSPFVLRLEVEGVEAVVPGPVIVLFRHVSIIDTLLPANPIARPYGIRLRYVLKRELLADPCLDVAGRRLPNYFVRRGTGEAQELERVRALAEGLGRDEGVLIYPEGTRFTPERRARAIARIAERDPQLAARAERLRHLLPPRRGGLVGPVVRVRATRVPRSAVPKAPAPRAEWLYELWQEVDDWLEAVKLAAAEEVSSSGTR